MPSAKLLWDSQEIVIVYLTDEERVSERIPAKSMGKAISALHRDGVVVLENAVDVEHMDKLNTIPSAEAEILASKYMLTVLIAAWRTPDNTFQ
ncbi:uncharacterized protein A1O9_07965 [Exophiala aquamarina CBS 119918]|uniref:Uncharacterized protein n=1 Tax=Exophiala aquamarina CBS 119918 TaxID=1182545 RepID=A0A072P8G5_9EURO|nr:uncharacterized protein A1O9_07965 [Exophiala aquamarina CBS 119918]KEF56384.1 hypothetical protein A1O9_07965 [Exophiala aquamarina CBS 119918]